MGCSKTLPWVGVFLFMMPLGQLPAADPSKEEIAKIALIGDSIRLSYAPIVTRKMNGKAKIFSPGANGGDSKNVHAHLDEWVIRERPDVVLFNCGIHDTKKFRKNGEYQVSPEKYEENLRAIVGRIRRETKATVLFATTTPIHDERAAKARSERDYELLNASVVRYNEIASKVMRDLDVPVLDLHSRLAEPLAPLTFADLVSSDGVHFVPKGQEVLAAAVVEFLEKQTKIAKK